MYKQFIESFTLILLQTELSITILVKKAYERSHVGSYMRSLVCFVEVSLMVSCKESTHKETLARDYEGTLYQQSHVRCVPLRDPSSIENYLYVFPYGNLHVFPYNIIYAKNLKNLTCCAVLFYSTYGCAVNFVVFCKIWWFNSS